jgi:hypothetical protein
MKKTFLFIVSFAFYAMLANSQNFKVGVRFNPLNSQYWVHELMVHDQEYFEQDKSVSQFDSLTMGIFLENYFSKKAFLVRLDINYADMKILETDNEISTGQSQPEIYDYAQVYKQKYININLGIGTHVDWSRFIFSFGIYVPFTILPEGEITRDVSYYYSGTLTQNTKCTGTYKPALGVGVGSFAGVNTIILKHISLGLDVSYQIEYLTRKLIWHGETYYYGYNPHMNYVDETEKIRNYFTSKLLPSIVIAYAFDFKKKTPPILNK